MLVILDLSAVFDTVDHNILLERLENWVGLSGMALKWFRSYLEGRGYYVSIGEHKSQWTSMTCGVPQGSILAPLFCCLHVLPLSQIMRKKRIAYIYAFSRRFYPKRLTLHSNYSFQIFFFYQLLLSLGIEPMILALLVPCSTSWATGKLKFLPCLSQLCWWYPYLPRHISKWLQPHWLPLPMHWLN